jgi:hypothetical protein
MSSWLSISIAAMALLTCACGSTFLVSKDGKGFYFGNNTKAMYEMLCTTGDFEKVLAVTHLSNELKGTLYQYNCSNERSGDRVKRIYASMTPEQRKDIINSFRKNGFAINVMAVFDDQCQTSGRI